jgi:hypothetical protein
VTLRRLNATLAEIESNLAVMPEAEVAAVRDRWAGLREQVDAAQARAVQAGVDA